MVVVTFVSTSLPTWGSLSSTIFSWETLEIENNRDITIHVDVSVLNVPMPIQLTTSIEPDTSDPTGTTFLEHFQGLQVAGQRIPIPSDWQRARPLEFSYVDETMLIARGNGGEPHYLKRGIMSSD